MDDSLERLRPLCLGLPDTTERISHGEPAWFVRDKKLFVTYANHHHDDRVALWCAAPDGAQEELVLADPEQFFRRPMSAGGAGWGCISIATPAGTKSPISSSTRTGRSPPSD